APVAKAPVLIGYAFGLYVAGDRAYVVGERPGGEDCDIGLLQIFDLTQPTNPVPSGITDTASYGYGVTVAGQYAYVVGQEVAFTIVKVSNPTNPVPVSSYSADGWAQA